jgi:hypothetical protein
MSRNIVEAFLYELDQRAAVMLRKGVEIVSVSYPRWLISVQVPCGKERLFYIWCSIV